jgi:DNA polymerase-1
MKNEKFVILDGNSYIHRAYHAIPHLTDSKGNVVNAVFGFMKMLKKIISEENPSHICVAFDNKKPTFRHEYYSEYKAHRKETDAELKSQFARLFKVLRALKIKHIDIAGYEADDIIATIAKAASGKKMPVTIVTSDKDIYQLINKNVVVEDGMRGAKYNEEKLEEKFGVAPEQMIDYLALIGDSSDNLPGVRGVGPVTAQKLLKDHGNLDSIYCNLEKIKPNVRQKLEASKDDAYKTQYLVRLVDNIELPFNIESCLWEGPDSLKLKEELEELNFKSLMSDWLKAESVRIQTSVKVIRDRKALEELLRKNTEAKKTAVEFIIDSGLLPGFEEVTGVGIAYNKNETFYIPTGHGYLGAGKQLSWEDVKNLLRKYLFGQKIYTIAHDLKKVYKFLKKEDIQLDNFNFDVITADYVLNPEAGKIDLKSISSRYLNWSPDEINDSPSSKEIDEMADTISGRLAVVIKLSEVMTEEIKRQEMSALYDDVEMKVLKILAEMEISGIKIDSKELNSASDEFRKEVARLEEEIYKAAGEKFNINSPKQLAVILFEKLGLEPDRKTKTGYSTGEDVLHKLIKQHELPKMILEYRKYQKLISTYIDPISLMMDPGTKRLHTTFNITGTATGRLSSSNPNLQNIPVRTHDGKIIRKTFIADEGKVLLSADYSQIDLRVLAHISGDKNLIKSFKDGADVHRLTASKVFGVEPAEVTPDMRKKAKAVNFGIAYGMSSKGLTKRVGMSENESEEFIAKYFEEYPGINEYINETVNEAKKKYYVKTILNRRRPLPEMNSRNPMRRSLTERMAINTPIQGSSADIIKVAMVELDKEFNFNRGDFKLLLQIHDELLFEVPENKVESLKEIIREKMEHAVKLSVPVIVDFKQGKNWRDMEAC